MDESKFVVFRLGRERFAVPIENVERILPTQKVTPIPKAPKLLLGVFDLRGTTVSVIDTHLRFDMPPAADAQNFVIVGSQAGRFALRVDEVLGIENFDEKDVDRDSRIFDGSDDKVVAGVGKRGSQLTILLDPDFIAIADTVTKIAA